MYILPRFQKKESLVVITRPFKGDFQVISLDQIIPRRSQVSHDERARLQEAAEELRPGLKITI